MERRFNMNYGVAEPPTPSAMSMTSPSSHTSTVLSGLFTMAVDGGNVELAGDGIWVHKRPGVAGEGSPYMFFCRFTGGWSSSDMVVI
jgi:hypothetical protein